MYIYVVLCLCTIRWKHWGHPQSQKEKHRFRLKLEKNRITSEKFKGSKSSPSHTRHFKNKITRIYI